MRWREAWFAALILFQFLFLCFYFPPPCLWDGRRRGLGRVWRGFRQGLGTFDEMEGGVVDSVRFFRFQFILFLGLPVYEVEGGVVDSFKVFCVLQCLWERERERESVCVCGCVCVWQWQWNRVPHVCQYSLHPDVFDFRVQGLGFRFNTHCTLMSLSLGFKV